MFPNKFSSIYRKCFCNKRFLSFSQLHLEKREHPLKRTIRILKEDLQKLGKPPESNVTALNYGFPKHADIVIIGGAAIGSSIAYFLKEKTGIKGLNVVVIEKDLSYSKCSTVLSVGGLRQQFSLPENIQMSLYGAEFLRSLKSRFGRDADVYFTPSGCLMLASDIGAQQLVDISKLQVELGAFNTILSKQQLKKKYSWLNVSDVEIGCLGLEKEGWFDPWSFLHILKRGAVQLGAHYINGSVVGFTTTERHDIIVEGVTEGTFQSLNELIVKLPNDDMKSIQFAYCIVAAGAESGEIAKLAKIGTGEGILTVPVPVTKRKRYVFCFNYEGDGPNLNTPLTVDYTGIYFRRDGLGGSFICGISPLPEDEPDTTDLSVDHSYFDEKIWPHLAHRVPAFNALKVRNSWAGYYDFNDFDENGIIGPHPYYNNLYFATGFSGHGIQQAPAVGRAVSEHILEGSFQTIDLSRLSFDRILVNKPMFEVCVV